MVAGAAMAAFSTLCAIALLAIAGHFITAMALAGVGGAAINYYTPAALIRLLAILRTGGRYVERLVTHEATLRVLARLRVWLFARLVPLAPAGLGGAAQQPHCSRACAAMSMRWSTAISARWSRWPAPPWCVLAVLAVTALYLPWFALPLAVLLGIAGDALPRRAWRRGRAPGRTVLQPRKHCAHWPPTACRGGPNWRCTAPRRRMPSRSTRPPRTLQQASGEIDRLAALGSAGVALAAQLRGARARWRWACRACRTGNSPARI